MGKRHSKSIKSYKKTREKRKRERERESEREAEREREREREGLFNDWTQRGLWLWC